MENIGIGFGEIDLGKEDIVRKILNRISGG
jgi:hypothetical protein